MFSVTRVQTRRVALQVGLARCELLNSIFPMANRLTRAEASVLDTLGYRNIEVHKERKVESDGGHS